MSDPPCFPKGLRRCTFVLLAARPLCGHEPMFGGLGRVLKVRHVEDSGGTGAVEKVLLVNLGP